jgi:hypothetical protein
MDDDFDRQWAEYNSDPDAYVEKTSPEYVEQLKRDAELRRKLKDYGKY